MRQFTPLAQFTPLEAYREGLQFKQENALRRFAEERGPDLMRGDANALAEYSRFDPPGAAQLQARAAESQQAGMERQQDIAKRLLGAVAQTDPQARPQAWQRARQQASSMGLDIAAVPEAYPGDEQFEMMNRLFNMPEQERTAFERQLEMIPEGPERERAIRIALKLEPGAQAPDKPPADPIAALRARADEAGLRQGTPEYRQFMLENGSKSGMALDVGPNGEISFRTGGAAGDPAFGKPAQNTLEGGIITDSDLIQRGVRLMQDYKPEYLTYQGQLESFVTKQAEKLGRDPGEVRKEALKGRQRFVMGIEQLFNQYRKEITGAAAAVAELDRLKKSFINMDMSPSEFESGMELFMEESARALRLKRKLLRDGVPATDLGSLLDDAFLGGQDDDPAARFGEIMQEVGDEEEAYRRLAAEGYSL
jgi:hypothetical protein